jgi:hypothetical protein
MTKTSRTLLALTLVLAGSALPSPAQGVQTGSLTGTVLDQGAQPLPGVTVTLTSPALQGSRTTLTDGNGVYVAAGLPPGQYAVRFELSGTRTVDATQRVDLGHSARVDAILKLALAESVQVTAPAPSIVTSTQGGANLRADDVNKLASIRTVWGIAELAPDATDNTPNPGQLTIGGGFAYSNQFMINGVDVADNIFATANNLFIEDALQEVQVLSSGISAEFGRFGGGVVNAITRSGGNTFSGSGRLNFYSPSWTRETPFETAAGITRQKNVQNNYEGTFGGPLMKDRLWFFTAGRYQKASTPAPLPETAIPFTSENTNKRGELKLTGTMSPNHTLQGSFINNSTFAHQGPVSGVIDLASMVSRTTPNTLWVTSYRGVLHGAALATLQVSGRHWGNRNGGGTQTDILSSPFRTRGVSPGVPSGRFYNAPYLDSNDPEDRDNRQATGSLNWMLTSRRYGSHDLKAGFENFVNRYVGGNSQTATGYVFRADYVTANGRPLLDAQGRVSPVFTPGVTRLENWLPQRGSKLEITTNSTYLQDHWIAGPRLSFDLGTRFEMVDSHASAGDVRTVNTQTIVPRLGASYDLTGTGQWIAQATYGHYSGAYTVPLFLGAAEVGNPSLVTRAYTGPAGQGLDFAPGFDPANYTTLILGSFPTANVSYEDGIQSPLTKEFTVGLGTPLGGRGAAKVLYQWRTMSNFVEDFVDDPSAAGKVLVNRNGANLGTFDRIQYRNTNLGVRDYQALIFQANRRLSNRWTADGSWTVQLQNNGNFEGEGASQPGIPTAIGNYPEMAVISRNEPTGRLNDFQRNKVRLWTTYQVNMARFGALDTAVLYRYNSPLTYSLVANGVPVTAAQQALDPGYATPLSAQTVYFGERGSGEFEGSQMVDLAFTYSVPVFRQLRPWIKAEIFNLFNDQSLVSFNTAVTPKAGGAVDAIGLPLEYTPSAAFGTATAITSYPRSAQNFAGQNLYARTFLLSTGFRF